MGGVILLASEARNDRPPRRRNPEIYPPGSRDRLPTPARQPCGVGAVDTRRAPGRVPGREPRAPSDRSRHRPIADPEFPSSPGREVLQSWALVKKEKMAQSLPLPATLAELSDRAELRHGKSHCTLTPGPHPIQPNALLRLRRPLPGAWGHGNEVTQLLPSAFVGGSEKSLWMRWNLKPSARFKPAPRGCGGPAGCPWA